MYRKTRIAALAATFSAVGVMMSLSAAPASANLPCVPLPSGIPPFACPAFENWTVKGSLTIAKQPAALQTVQLPAGGEWNGVYYYEVCGAKQPCTLPFGPNGEPENDGVVYAYPQQFNPACKAETPEILYCIQGALQGISTVPPFTQPLQIFGNQTTIVGETFTPERPVNAGVRQRNMAECAAYDGLAFTCAQVTVPLKVKLAFTVTGPGEENTRGATHCETTALVDLPLASDPLPAPYIVTKGTHYGGTYTIPSITCGGPQGSQTGKKMTAAISGPGNSYSLFIAAP